MFQIFHEPYVLLRIAGIHFFGLFGRAGAGVLIEGLGEYDKRLVDAAEAKLKNMGSKANRALIKALKSKNTLIQSRAAILLGELEADAVIPLSETMKSEDLFVRLEALSALGLVGRKNHSAIPFLIEALIDPSVRIRKKAKETLKEIGSPAQSALLEALESKIEVDKYHAHKVAEALSRFGENAVPELVDILKSERKKIKPYIMFSLRLIGEAALPNIISLLKEKNSSVRASAAHICGMMIHKAKDALPALTDALADENDDVRFCAAMALGIIGGDASHFVPVLEELTRPLEKRESFELFFKDCDLDRVQLTDKSPIIGEVGWDRLGIGYLAPEKDYRGGGMHSVILVGKYFRSGKGTRGDLTRVSGFYAKGTGLLVTNMVAHEDPSDLGYWY